MQLYNIFMQCSQKEIFCPETGPKPFGLLLSSYYHIDEIRRQDLSVHSFLGPISGRKVSFFEHCSREQES